MAAARFFDFRMKDGSRNFADLPEIVFFEELRLHARQLKGAIETDFVTDWVTEMWLDISFEGHKFSINNQFGDFWFFVEDPDCPDEILLRFYSHFKVLLKPMDRFAYFGGTFDPVHKGHLNIGRLLAVRFRLDEFYFLPAFHAPHKPDRPPTSAYHRHAMLVLATESDPKLRVSTLELEKREKRYTIDTLADLRALHPEDEIFFVMGADSWNDIRTWRDWENVLLGVNHIVVTRPGFPLSTDHVSDAVRERIVDLRSDKATSPVNRSDADRIYFTDAVIYDVSATELRTDLADGHLDRKDDVPAEVAKYIEKYELYR